MEWRPSERVAFRRWGAITDLNIEVSPQKRVSEMAIAVEWLFTDIQLVSSTLGLRILVLSLLEDYMFT